MNYYNIKKQINKELINIIEQARKEGKKDVDINLIVYTLTLTYDIGENTIRKRIELMGKISDYFYIKDDKVIFQ